MNKFKVDYFGLYLLFIGFFALIWLFIKKDVGNDWGISEWIINYQGGFTRRGLPGEVAFNIAQTFNLQLRFVIFLIQSIFYLTYLVLIYNFFKKIKINIFIIFAIFSPIFLLYHVAELESLARKEIFLFIGYLWFYNISKKQDPIIKPILWVIFILPIVSILYEPAIFYYSFFAATIIIKTKKISLIKILTLLILIFIPSIILSWFSAFNLIDTNGFNLMKLSLYENFGENCYGSCNMMSTKKEVSVHIMSTISKLTERENSIFIYLFRYTLIMLIGSAPLLILIKNSVFNIKVFGFQKLIYPFLILNVMVPIHWLMFIDWGRAVNITYVSSILFFFYLYKNNFIKINFTNIKKQTNNFIGIFLKNNYIKRKPLVVFIFIIYAFGWSPPTLLSADVNSFPGYRIPYKTSKLLFSNN
ncbi:hypothetical protein OAS84_02160 [Candidatus Pelagibacter sp.]|nr:hypothetical protein [Candidatus Pelagibacter sp.]